MFSLCANACAYTLGVFEIIGLIVIQVFLLALGVTLGAICLLLVSLAIRGVTDSRGKRIAMVTAFLFPLIAVFYLEAGVVIHDVVRYAAGKDSNLDGSYRYPLGNGYVLRFFDETGPGGGWIDDPRGGSLSVDRIYGLQVAGDFMFMDADRQPQQGTTPTVTVAHGEVHQPANTDRLHLYVELNTKTHERSDFPSLEDLKRAAARRNLQLQLVPLDDFYNEAVSAAAPGWLFFGFLGTPLLITGGGLLRGLHRLRLQFAGLS